MTQIHTLRRAAIAVLLTGAALPAPALAQSAADWTAIRQELNALRAEQAASAARIAKLENALATAQAAAAPTPAQAAPAFQVARSAPASEPSPAAPVNAAGGSSPGIPPVAVASRLTINGDLRVRYESNFGDQDARNRDRGVMRGRIRAAFAVNKWLSIGGELSTGDSNDPNSTDITLTRFDDDLDVSLSQAYFRTKFGELTLVAGKIPQPFVRTELVWDGDVNPEGASASYRIPLGTKGANIKLNALYSLVDEAPTAKDSHMIGGQVALETSASDKIKLELAAGYYDYRLAALTGGDTGDFRTNRFSGGRYLSDFNLLDVIGAVQYNGLGAKWPVRVVGDYVKNFGATVPDDSGFGVDLLIGRASKRGDMRFGYGYAELDVDGALAAFTHDNTNIATNYLQHTLLVDYAPADNVVLNATYYRYRPKNPLYAGGNAPTDWLDRLRLNLLVNF